MLNRGSVANKEKLTKSCLLWNTIWEVLFVPVLSPFFFFFLSFLSHKFNNVGHIAILENIQQRIRGMQGKQIVAHCLLRYSLLFFVSPSDLTVWKERLPREGHAKATRKPRESHAITAQMPRERLACTRMYSVQFFLGITWIKSKMADGLDVFCDTCFHHIW